MAIVVLCVGAFLTLMGIIGYLYGLDTLPSERGVAGVIAASVALVGGVITIALGLVLKRMDDLMKLLPGAAARPATEPVGSVLDEGDIQGPGDRGAAPIELPKIVPVEPPRAVEAVETPPVRPGLPTLKGPVVAAGAAAAGAAAATVAATAGREAVEKALELDVSPPELPKIVPLEPKLPKIEPLDLPKIELPKLDLPKLDLPKLDIPKLDLPKFDLPSATLSRPEPDESVTDRSAQGPEFAHRDEEEEFPVEVLEPVAIEDAPVPAAGKPVDPLQDFELELERLIPLSDAGKPAKGEAAPVSDGDEPADEKDALSFAKAGSLPIKDDAEAASEKTAIAAEPAGPEVDEKPPVAPRPAPGAEVVGAYESGGAKYTMYSDGSVVAEAGGETLFFKSLEELREFIDEGVKS
jgi:hypothetical protein